MPDQIPFTSDEISKAISTCEEIIGYEFQDKSYLGEAITHASVADSRLVSYERLEFLGDSILGFVVCDHLFATFPNWLEGDLTQIKSHVVSRESCAKIGRQLDLEKILIVGKGVGTRGRVPKSLLANAFESIVAAIYLDGGLGPVRAFLMPLVKTRVKDAIEGDFAKNYKADLQQYAQKRYGAPPVYELQGSRGPDHEKWFKIAARVSKVTYAPSWGKNKKQAEQRAAANALAAINDQPVPYPADEPNE